MSPEVVNCLVNEMKISWDHFQTKYSSFSSAAQSLIDSKLLEMLEVSRSIKAKNIDPDDFNSLYYEGGDGSTNEFLQVMFDCFKEWQSHEGVELHKSIYEHTNRSTDNQFPVVKIEEKINECSVLGRNFVVYRGCNQDEFETNTFKQRQSWTRDFDIAKDPSDLITGEETLDELIRIAIGFEKESIVFFSSMKDVVPPKFGKDRVDDLIRQEVTHIAWLSERLAAST